MPNYLQWDYVSRVDWTYKIRYGLVDINWRIYLTEVKSITRGHRSRFWVPDWNTQVYHSQSFFFPCTSWDWNGLSTDPASRLRLCLRFARLLHQVSDSWCPVTSHRVSLFIQHSSTCTVLCCTLLGCVLHIGARSQLQCIDLHKTEVAFLKKEGRHSPLS